MDTKVVIGVVAVVIVAVIASWLIAAPGQSGPTEGTVTQSTTTGQTATTTTAGVPAPPEASTEPQAVAAARTALATKLGVDEKSITTAQVETETWSDGCLGLGGPAESCLQALIDGYRVTLQASGKTYVYRTDTSGASVRAE